MVILCFATLMIATIAPIRAEIHMEIGTAEEPVYTFTISAECTEGTTPPLRAAKKAVLTAPAYI